MTDREFKLKSKQLEKLSSELGEEKNRRNSIERYKNLLNNLKNRDWFIDKITFNDEYGHEARDHDDCIWDLNLVQGCKKQHDIYKDAREDLRNLVISFLEDYIKKLED